MSSTGELIRSLLDDHGCQYEENVVHQLNEYAMKLMKILIQQSQEVTDLSKRTNITYDDIKVAYESLQNPSLSIKDLQNYIGDKSKQNLSEQEDYSNNFGIKLPANEQNKFIRPNYQVIVKSKMEVENGVQIKAKQEETDKYTKTGRKKINIFIDQE